MAKDLSGLSLRDILPQSITTTVSKSVELAEVIVSDDVHMRIRAYEQMKAEHKRYRCETDGLLASLESQIEEERSAWQKTARRAGKSGVGVFGDYAPFREQAVSGIGYVLILF